MARGGGVAMEAAGPAPPSCRPREVAPPGLRKLCAPGPLRAAPPVAAAAVRTFNLISDQTQPLTQLILTKLATLQISLSFNFSFRGC